MKKATNAVKRILSFVLVCLLVVSFTACKPKDDGGSTKGSITMVLTKDTIAMGETITVAVAVSNAKDPTYEVKSLNPAILEVVATVDNGKTTYSLKIKDGATVSKDTEVQVKASLTADESVEDVKTVTVKANAATGKSSISINTVNPANGSDKYVLRVGDEQGLKLKVDLEVPYDDKSYKVVFDNDSLVSYDSESGIIKVKEGVNLTDKALVNVTVTSVAAPKLSQRLTLTVKPKLATGSVGDLTQAMIDEIANGKITVNGVVKDVVKYNAGEGTSSENSYGTTVELDGERWKGSWWSTKDSDPAVNENVYAKGEEFTLNGKTVHKTEELYVNKKNESASKVLKDSEGNFLTWESRHYVNHVGGWVDENGASHEGLKVGKFEEVGDNVFRYDIEFGTTKTDFTTFQEIYYPSEDDYLMLYLTWSFTPILSSNDVIENFYIYVETVNGVKKVTKIMAETFKSDITKEDSSSGKDVVIGYSNTECTLSFDAIGTTTVAAPAAHEEINNPKYEAFKKALAKMANVQSYTFKMTESNSYSPTIDPSDYEISGTIEGGEDTGEDWRDFSLKPFASKTGEVGYRGLVTTDGALINRTIEYTSYYTNPYRTDVSGYKQNDDGTYDEFEYADGMLKGKYKKNGSFASLMPDFDVSPYIFKWNQTGAVEGSENSEAYTFILRDSAITEEVAKAFCLSIYAKNAVSSVDKSMSFVVTVKADLDKNGNVVDATLVKVGFGYDIYGNWGGVYTTLYTNVNSTTLPAGMFDAEHYVGKKIPESWADYKNITYHNDFSTAAGAKTTVVSGDKLVELVFGKTAAENATFNKMPGALSKAFNDYVYGPWHEYEVSGVDSNGNNRYTSYINFRMQYDDCDENKKINDYDAFLANLIEQMSTCGFEYVEANSGKVGTSRSYHSFVNNELKLQFVVENWGNAHFEGTLGSAGFWVKPTE